MSFDLEQHLDTVERSVSALDVDGKPARAVTLERSLDTTVDDLWDAVTNPERIPRWFLPVSGDLRQGGRYHLEGNASGAITTCDRPAHLALTWEFGDDTSWVDVSISDAGAGRARVKLTHTALFSPHWEQYGAGAAGVGWELGFIGLAMYVAHPDEPKLDEQAFAASPEGKALMIRSSEGWGQASVKAGEDETAAKAAAKQTAAFYTGESQEPPSR